MKIAVTSQNLRTITGHAGKARRFIVFDVLGPESVARMSDIDLPREMSIHEHPADQPHPLDEIDLVITAGCGAGFIDKLQRRNTKVVKTCEIDPARAASAVARGEALPPPASHAHEHEPS